MTASEITFMIEYVTKNLISLLMEKYNYSVETAFDVLYNSETFQKLTDEKTGLYFQSPNYIFSFLTNEIESGKIR